MWGREDDAGEKKQERLSRLRTSRVSTINYQPSKIKPEPLAFLVHAAIMALLLNGQRHQITHQQQRDRHQPAQHRHDQGYMTVMHSLFRSGAFRRTDWLLSMRCSNSTTRSSRREEAHSSVLIW